MIGNLVRRAQAGDLDATGRLYELHYQMVYGFMLRRVKHRQDAEDLAGLTFLTVLRKLPAFKLDGGRGYTFYALTVSRWIIGIARNTLLLYFDEGRKIPRFTDHDAKAHWHRVSDVDPETRTGTCSICGMGARVRQTKKRGHLGWTCSAGSWESEKRRKAIKAGRYDGPLLPTHAHSVDSVPVSDEWVLRHAVDAVSDFHGAPEDHPVWEALDRAVKESLARRRRPMIREVRVA